MALSDHVHMLGQDLRVRHGTRVHKVSVDAGFTCPNIDGRVGRGGCTFCNNRSFAPGVGGPSSVTAQIKRGRQVVARRTGAQKFLVYFQAYTNTYADLQTLRSLYDAAVREPDVVGLSIGTRPDCTPAPVLRLLSEYQDQGFDVWLELGLQSAFDATLMRINRGHGWQEYRSAVQLAHQFGLRVCTHLIAGLPGETSWHAQQSLARVIELGVEGLKLHPLHVVRGTRLAHDWRSGAYQPLEQGAYVDTVTTLVRQTPAEVVYHRLTGTAKPPLLLAPDWCAHKWPVLNAIEAALATSSTCGAKVHGTGLSSRESSLTESRR